MLSTKLYNQALNLYGENVKSAVAHMDDKAHDYWLDAVLRLITFMVERGYFLSTDEHGFCFKHRGY